MRTLYLLRHAKSSWQDDTLDDFDRPLKKRGEAAAALVGSVIAAEKLSDLLIVSSPAERARETTRIVVQSGELSVEVRFDPRIYHADLSALLSVLNAIESEKEVTMLVGHNPGMETLVRYLSGEVRAMPTAALAKINLTRNSWKDLRSVEGTLTWLVTPKEIFGD